jgi:hypothetical protein
MNERNIRLLEDRVTRAVERLRELTAERTRLDREVKELKGRLAAVERELTAARAAAPAVDWKEFTGTIRAAVEELRRN